jgi:hypothetical protein
VNPSDLEVAIAALETVCTHLSSTALTDCWIETWQRGTGHRYRLHYRTGVGLPPRYLQPKEVPDLQRRIDQGRQLKILQAAIGVMRGLVDREF